MLGSIMYEGYINVMILSHNYCYDKLERLCDFWV